MKIYLFLENKVLMYTIPVKKSGSFSFGEENELTENLINIEARNDEWILYSTNDARISENGTYKEYVSVVPFSYYKIVKDEVTYLIYITNLFDETFSSYKYGKDIDLIIGNDSNCNMKITSEYIKGEVCKITYNEDKLSLIINTNQEVYVNNLKPNSENLKYSIKTGDQINIYGYRIIIFNDFLMINNPGNSVVVYPNTAKLVSYSIPHDNSKIDLAIKERDLYTNADYYSKSPRLTRIIKTFKMQLSAPPKRSEDDVMPTIVKLGPSLTMLLTSMVRLEEAIEKITSGETTLAKSWPSIATTALMMVSSFVWPTISNKITEKMKAKKDQTIEKKYDNYLHKKESELLTATRQQGDILSDNLIPVQKCVELINAASLSFWDKRIEQKDFLEVRLGIGNQKMDAEITYNIDDFTIEDDNLKTKADALIENYKYIKGVPVGYSFSKCFLTAIMGDEKKRYGLINNILLQLLTFYSYDDLKIVVLTNERNKKKWEYIKYLNHNMSNDKSIRYFSSNYEESKYILGELEQILAPKYQECLEDKNGKFEITKPYYLIITDDFSLIKNHSLIKMITESNKNFGCSLIILESLLKNLPSKCNNFINIRGHESGILINSLGEQEQIKFNDEINYDIDMMQIVKKLANVPIEIESETKALPNSITFLEMEKVGKVEQLNIMNRWDNNNSVTSLKSEIGVDSEGNLMYLDLHEKCHGPHGLIAGTTGSGKSEFIITYILSMCVNYSPDDVAFILIDYKGGGLAYAFENKTSNIVLPHLAGTITNLDKAEMHRTLVSIDSEIKRRQNEFNKARDLLGESTIDIYKYQKFYHEGKVKTPIPHLFIICDEFAELKSQQPDFMDNLISVARIGRSLGVHLILATQKPSGVVNEQIWSNTKFRVCLKVQNEGDSNEVLKRPEAAYIKNTGRYYLQVGVDELFVMGQSAWCGAKYFPTEKIIKQVNKSVDFIDNNGVIIKSIEQEDNNIKIEAKGEQLGAVLKNIIDTAKLANKYARKLWLPDIEPNLNVVVLEKKYGYSQMLYDVEAIIGEYDAPEKQEQGLLKYSLKKDGNALIVSSDEVEKENLLHTIIYSACRWHNAKELNIYIMDFGSESLRMFNSFPQVGGISFISTDEKNKNLFKLIEEQISIRKKLLVEYGGSIDLYNNKHEEKLPQILLVINNIESILETYETFEETLVPIARDCERYGINIILTASSTHITRRITQCFRKTYALHLQDTSDYTEALGTKVTSKPKECSGRGYCVTADGIAHEFQSSCIVTKEINVVEYLSAIAGKLKQKCSISAPRIPTLPDKVTLDVVESEISTIHNVPIGIYRNSLKVARYDFLLNKYNTIASNRLNNISSFMDSLLEVMLRLTGIGLFFVDPTKSMKFVSNKTYNNRKINYFDDNFDEVLQKFEVMTKSEEYRKFGFVFILYGVDKLKSLISIGNLTKLIDGVKKADNCTIIMCDSTQTFKSFEFEQWYSKVKDTANGIWIGKGFEEQNNFRISKITKEMGVAYPLNYGYLVSENTAELVKYIEFNDIIREGEKSNEK